MSDLHLQICVLTCPVRVSHGVLWYYCSLPPSPRVETTRSIPPWHRNLKRNRGHFWMWFLRLTTNKTLGFFHFMLKV
uniref:Uncharacterized protein n=1 Tax=Glycine max TaxID=3847 RepID=C6SW86_SOYBN|nr:unknown [Glycine max]